MITPVHASSAMKVIEIKFVEIGWQFMYQLSLSPTPSISFDLGLNFSTPRWEVIILLRDFANLMEWTFAKVIPAKSYKSILKNRDFNQFVDRRLHLYVWEKGYTEKW